MTSLVSLNDIESLVQSFLNSDPDKQFDQTLAGVLIIDGRTRVVSVQRVPRFNSDQLKQSIAVTIGGLFQLTIDVSKSSPARISARNFETQSHASVQIRQQDPFGVSFSVAIDCMKYGDTQSIEDQKEFELVLDAARVFSKVTDIVAKHNTTKTIQF